MLMRGLLIAAAMVAALPAFAQVRIINGQTDQVYGPRGVIMDDQGKKARAADKQAETKKVPRLGAPSPIWSPLDDPAQAVVPPVVRLNPMQTLPARP
jgi:hypothetical protein